MCIRDSSIAHGNYRVIFMGELSKSKIIFNDIYEGKLTFHGEISILDFINMIANNLIAVSYTHLVKVV